MALALTVVTFNIRSGLAWDGRHSWPLRRWATRRALAELGADVAALQEAHSFQLDYLLRGLPCYASAGAGRTDGWRRGERCALLYRPARLQLIDAQTRWLSRTPDVPGSVSWGSGPPRVATLAHFVDRTDGSSLGLVSTHWDGASFEARTAGASLLADWLDRGLEWVVAGDLNASPADAAVRLMLRAGLRDALSHLPTRGAGAGTHHGFTGATNRSRIDHILVTGGWGVLSAGVRYPRPAGLLPSDHWPIAARLIRSVPDPAHAGSR